jgi:hypothetical protein
MEKQAIFAFEKGYKTVSFFDLVAVTYQIWWR